MKADVFENLTASLHSRRLNGDRRLIHETSGRYYLFTGV